MLDEPSTYAEHYATSPYAAFDQEWRRGGSFGIEMAHTVQDANELTDPALLYTTFVGVCLADTPAELDFGNGWKGHPSIRTGQVDLQPADRECRFRIAGRHTVLIVSLDAVHVTCHLDEVGLRSDPFEPLYAAMLGRPDDLRLMKTMWTAARVGGAASDLLVYSYALALLGRFAGMAGQGGAWQAPHPRRRAPRPRRRLRRGPSRRADPHGGPRRRRLPLAGPLLACVQGRDGPVPPRLPDRSACGPGAPPAGADAALDHAGRSRLRLQLAGALRRDVPRPDGCQPVATPRRPPGSSGRPPSEHAASRPPSFERVRPMKRTLVMFQRRCLASMPGRNPIGGSGRSLSRDECPVCPALRPTRRCCRTTSPAIKPDLAASARVSSVRARRR